MAAVYKPLICTQNSLFHVDYGTPLLATKSTDYRTSTGKNHDYMPSIAQDFDCRVKSNIKPELLEKDVVLKTAFSTSNSNQHNEKYNVEKSIGNDRAKDLPKLQFIRNAEEKIFMNPPPPKPPKISEMKDSYPFHYKWPSSQGDTVNFKCEIPDTYRSIQPNINPAEKGFYKLLDIYLTENKSKYVPYSKEQLAKAQEDLVTFYNANGKHKGLTEELPGRLTGNQIPFDRIVFKPQYPNRIQSKAPKLVPNLGMSSEYQSNYHNPGYAEFRPYIQESGIYFPETIPKSSAWQDLCPPAMYCSEYCHIGGKWPVRATVDLNRHVAEKLTPHLENEKCT